MIKKMETDSFQGRLNLNFDILSNFIANFLKKQIKSHCKLNRIALKSPGNDYENPMACLLDIIVYLKRKHFFYLKYEEQIVRFTRNLKVSFHIPSVISFGINLL